MTLNECIATLFDIFFFFNDTATTEIYTLSLHDALPICQGLGYPSGSRQGQKGPRSQETRLTLPFPSGRDRKSTRLNSSHLVISYAVFCLKKKKKTTTTSPRTTRSTSSTAHHTPIR